MRGCGLDFWLEKKISKSFPHRFFWNDKTQKRKIIYQVNKLSNLNPSLGQIYGNVFVGFFLKRHQKISSWHFLTFSDVDESKERFDDKSVLIVSARLDAINLFDKLEFGFDSPSLGIVTLLAAVQILNQNEKFKGLYYFYLNSIYSQKVFFKVEKI